MKLNKQLIVILSIISLTSCVSRKKYIYFQGNEQVKESIVSQYETRIQPDDIIYLGFSSQNPESVDVFNLDSKLAAQNVNFNVNRQSYLVDKNGNIEFPVLGSIKIAGMTRVELTDFFKEKLKKYATDIVVNLRIINFKVSVLGEVGRPGIINVGSDRFTILDALAQASDITLYGKKENVLIIRDVEGKKTYNYVDITKADLVNSPFYYLKQNDVIYVEPREVKVNSTAIGSNLTTTLSIFGSLLTLYILITRI
ncbi:hypothetical protein B0A58_07990 [Flavobacterium branchiophilum NBRC 15030 = ATCC 35035]|uniref:Polysaccharide export outer membrane protein n=2 Tax=Flavobacterium branchiophilum TaxID=55197 RepID=A0A2H3KEW1_9FLAO|nr:polysaccharide biosynthesis/export family protein [Flavobacterium branchiophilum]OXA76006.1 hypothetical protein B0A58_07990 [Flavobacterium branchiophilum NBRC 15030 = ATCC 35035]PDS26895.1 sugar transporter [Flavobacterium branchiophilum]TQM42096.1 polysaccharide export outer membrane protein [Flavobacterium branchiophilum]CCB69649.1 Probable polysaccharide exporter lipoprotein precursor [Flavobacterium branchiophilum FL-15]GEM53869.1 polysaccharide biosynthesis protein [Flavobacterium br